MSKNQEQRSNVETPPRELEALSLGKGVRILMCHSSGLLVFEKPAGVLTHPNRKGDIERSLARTTYDFESESYSWVDLKGRERRLFLIHRLDAPTSGALVAALDSELAGLVREEFRERRAQKAYVALTLGAPRAGVWRDRWREGADRNGRGGSGPLITAESKCQILPLGRAQEWQEMGLETFRLAFRQGRDGSHQHHGPS